MVRRARRERGPAEVPGHQAHRRPGRPGQRQHPALRLRRLGDHRRVRRRRRRRPHRVHGQLGLDLEGRRAHLRRRGQRQADRRRPERHHLRRRRQRHHQGRRRLRHPVRRPGQGGGHGFAQVHLEPHHLFRRRRPDRGRCRRRRPLRRRWRRPAEDPSLRGGGRVPRLARIHGLHRRQRARGGHERAR